jgi:hypothetical protein
MVARIQRSFDLLACVQFDPEFCVNFYEFDVTFNVGTDSIEEQNIALERIKCYLEVYLHSSIFIQEGDTEAIERLLTAGMKVCVLPEEPYDQIVGIMLLQKFNAITEGRLIATDIAISSHMSDGVTCFHAIEENNGPFALKGWWDDVAPTINGLKPKNKKVVKLSKPINDWSEFKLEWEDVPKKQSTSEIVVVTFDKTDK